MKLVLGADFPDAPPKGARRRRPAGPALGACGFYCLRRGAQMQAPALCSRADAAHVAAHACACLCQLCLWRALLVVRNYRPPQG